MSNNIFNSKIKNTSIILLIVGILFVVIGFVSTPSTIEEVTSIIGSKGHHDASHLEHALNQFKNRPWSAVYVSLLFFTLISLGAMVFYAIQYVARAGWSVVVLKVMDSVGRFLPIGGGLLILFFILSGLHMNHIFHWMVPGIDDPTSEHYDEIIAGKTGYLNFGFFIIRAIIYLAIWSFLFKKLREFNDLQALKGTLTDVKYYIKSVTFSAAFLVFFAVSSSMMAWDWIMSIDTHWFSTLFGWYVFSSFFVSAISVITIVTIYLKTIGKLPNVNQYHIHDLAKFMFAFSIFWSYLWFSQFILIWYANIPEEVTYYMQRWDEYKLLFWSTFVINFVFPVLILMNSDMKKTPWFVIISAICILTGHYFDFYLMITPGSVGEHWGIGFAEIGAFIAVLGGFVWVLFKALDKTNLDSKNHPFVKESEHHHL